MAHAAPPPPGQARRYRIIGVGALILGIVALVVIFVGIKHNGHDNTADVSRTPGSSAGLTTPATTPATTSVTPTPTPTPTPTRTTAKPTPTPTRTATPAVAKVPLVIANNTNRSGLAATAESRFEAKGWKVTTLTNFTGGILSTCAYYDPSSAANEKAATELQKEFPAIKRVKPRFDGLPEGPVVVVLTTDYH